MNIDRMTAKTYAAYLADRHSDVGFILAMVRWEFGPKLNREQVEKIRAEAVKKAERKAWMAKKWDRIPQNSNEARAFKEARAA